MQILRNLPGYPELSSSEKHLKSTREEMDSHLLQARQRLESVELLADSSLRDSRLLAEYLEKDLEHLGQRMQEMKVPAPETSAGWLASLKSRLRPANPANLDSLHSFHAESGEKSHHLSEALKQANARLDFLEQSWKSFRSSFGTAEDKYLSRLRRIGYISLSVLLLTAFAGYRIYKDQPEQKFYRKHLQPLKSVLDPATFNKMEGLASDSRSDFLRVEDLIKIRIGLETFNQTRGSYPGSSGQRFSTEGKRGPDWIPEIRSVVPAALPMDRREGDDPDLQYLYITDGADYKILAQSPENCEAVQKWLPEMIDPVRGCDAIGYWTAGGKEL